MSHRPDGHRKVVVVLLKKYRIAIYIYIMLCIAAYGRVFPLPYYHLLVISLVHHQLKLRPEEYKAMSGISDSSQRRHGKPTAFVLSTAVAVVVAIAVLIILGLVAAECCHKFHSF